MSLTRRKTNKTKKTYHLKNINSLLNDRVTNENIRVISNFDDSGSNSRVLLYTHNKSQQNFIIKHTLPNKNFGLKHVIIESDIYKHLSLLPLLNITPCIYKGFDVVKFKNEDKSKGNEDNLLMLNETGNNNTKIYSLEIFLQWLSDLSELKNKLQMQGGEDEQLKFKIYKYIVPNILFQFLYTMECLNNIKFKHNDLHPGNILIEFNDENILKEDYVINKYNEYIITKKDIFYNFNINNDTLNYLFNSKNLQYSNEKKYNLPDIGINIKIFDFDNSILFNEKNESTLLCKRMYRTDLTFYEKKKYKSQTIPTNIKNNTIPNNIDDIYGNIIFQLFNTIIGKIPDTLKNNYKDLFNKIFSNTKTFTKGNFIIAITDALDIKYLKNKDTYNELFKKYKLPYDLLMENNGIFVSSGVSSSDSTVFNFTLNISGAKLENIYNTKNIEYYWTTLNTEIEKYRIRKSVSKAKSKTLKSNTATRTNKGSSTTKTRKSNSNLNMSTDFNILKNTIKAKFNDNLDLSSFTNDSNSENTVRIFPKLISSQPRLIQIQKTKSESFFKSISSFLNYKNSNNNLLSSNSENSSSSENTHKTGEIQEL
jgi:hypothetical protein